MVLINFKRIVDHELKRITHKQIYFNFKYIMK